MRTRFPPIDKGRENIFELLRQLVEALKNKEIQQAITAIHTQLLQATYKQFMEEETDIDERCTFEDDDDEDDKQDDQGDDDDDEEGKTYTKEQMHKHKHVHILLRQRLTILGDLIRTGDEATNAVVCRIISQIYDSHFANEDVLYAERAIPEDEKVQNTGENAAAPA
ncbi:MAG: hypothetical protein EZS28_045440 [Streblomastix strix]|uniref:Hemerythrin-like domain-containing protein n=1 Tax=Streblomastix strix TaxID=222440 RepID=A0A5J4TMM7_9EUKA|nr:MAG: hypothetical protein EZS28_045440 [Streblomastix strix]